MRDVPLSERFPQYSKEDLLSIIEFNRCWSCNLCKEYGNDNHCGTCAYRTLESLLAKNMEEVSAWVNK